MKKVFLIGLLALIISDGQPAFAQKNNGLAVLKMDIDARAMALSGAYTALTADASSSYWNPAGLSLASRQSAIVMYKDWFWDISQSFAAVQFKTGKNSFALAFNMLRIPGIQIRGENPEETSSGSSEAVNLSAGLSYATIFSDWRVGVTIKYLFERYYFTSAPGWAADFGVMRQNVVNGLDWGLGVLNIGKMSDLGQQATPLPFMVRSGFAYKPSQNFLENKLTFLPEVSWVDKEKVYFHLGAQYNLADYLALRGGIQTGNESLRWSMGLGINYNTFHVDYAYSPLEYDLGTSSTFSLGLNF